MHAIMMGFCDTSRNQSHMVRCVTLMTASHARPQLQEANNIITLRSPPTLHYIWIFSMQESVICCFFNVSSTHGYLLNCEKILSRVCIWVSELYSIWG